MDLNHAARLIDKTNSRIAVNWEKGGSTGVLLRSSLLTKESRGSLKDIRSFPLDENSGSL